MIWGHVFQSKSVQGHKRALLPSVDCGHHTCPGICGDQFWSRTSQPASRLLCQPHLCWKKMQLDTADKKLQKCQPIARWPKQSIRRCPEATRSKGCLPLMPRRRRSSQPGPHSAISHGKPASPEQPKRLHRFQDGGSWKANEQFCISSIIFSPSFFA